MTPSTMLPEADLLPLPAPAPLLRALLLLTTLLHFVAMNALVGGLVLAAWSRWRARAVGGEYERMTGGILKLAPTLVAATVTLGVAPLLFLQVLYGQFFFTSSVILGWSWFSVVVTLVVAYYGTYLLAFRGERLGAARTPLLLGVLALLFWVAFVYTNNTTLMLRPATWPALYFAAPGGTSLNLGDPQLFPRWLHMLVGAVAVAGLLLAWWGRARAGREPNLGAAARRLGIGAFFWATMINFGLGLLFFALLARPAQKQLMGGDPLASGLLAIGIVLALVLVGAGARLRRDPDRGLAPATLLVAVTLVAMVLVRDAVRSAYLASAFQPERFAVSTQVLNLALFAALLVGGIVVVGWMVRRFAAAGTTKTGAQ